MIEAESLFFDAFANRNRFRILEELKDKDMCAGELQKLLGVEQTNLSHDLKCLLNCKFVSVRKDGRRRVYGITPDTKEVIEGVLRHVKKYEDYLRRCGVLKGEGSPSS